MRKLRVFVADDSQFMRVAYQRILQTQDHLEVVGMAGDGEEAIRQAEALKPDVAILDVRMPGLNGIEVAQRLTASRPGTGVVIYLPLRRHRVHRRAAEGRSRGQGIPAEDVHRRH